MPKECVCCDEKDETKFRKGRKRCKKCERALQAPWQGQTAYMKAYMARKREKDPEYGRNTHKGLQSAFKTLSKHPEYLLSKHPLASHSDFREMMDKSPDPFEALCRAEEAA